MLLRIEMRLLVPEGTHLPSEQRLQFRHIWAGVPFTDESDWEDVPTVVAKTQNSNITPDMGVNDAEKQHE